MDRFIVREYLFLKIQQSSLKSNMDRFIVTDIPFCSRDFLTLKSNMDRFIDITFRYTKIIKYL